MDIRQALIAGLLTSTYAPGNSAAGGPELALELDRECYLELTA